jgi:hypothetical protein
VALLAGRQRAPPGSAVKVKVALGGRRIELERAALEAQAEVAAPVGLPAARVEEVEVPVGLPVALVVRDGRVGLEVAG